MTKTDAILNVRGLPKVTVDGYKGDVELFNKKHTVFVYRIENEWFMADYKRGKRFNKQGLPTKKQTISDLPKKVENYFDSYKEFEKSLNRFNIINKEK